jgi:uroporphyrin-III C-methyltransferase / precorrin-2 dehydrogenase / sirohydrochlorin ferrochelatase
MTTVVSIVGAGPGAPDLITVRGARRLASADVVLYDGLVPRAVVDLALRATRRIPVSRRPGSDRVSPAAAAAMMIAAARSGARVVRLRAGDPFILARGAEESLALVDAGVPIEIVPGLTSASAAPTLAGIPLTHRGLASGFVVVSGHDAEAYGPVLGALPPGSATIVVLMGLAERGRIAELLISRGWKSRTPAAVIVDASQPTQAIERLTLGALGESSRARPTAAGVIVIGDVVELGLVIAEGASASRPIPTAAVEAAARPFQESPSWQQ